MGSTIPPPVRYRVSPSRYSTGLSMGIFYVSVGFCYTIFLINYFNVPLKIALNLPLAFVGMGLIHLLAYASLSVAITQDGIRQTRPLRRALSLPSSEWTAIRVKVASTTQVIIRSPKGAIKFSNGIANFQDLVDQVVQMAPHLLSESEAGLLGYLPSYLA